MSNQEIPVPDEYRAMMTALAGGIDQILNGPNEPKKLGFVLLMFELGEDLKGTGRINYVGNGKREDVHRALVELLARWEGRYSEPEQKRGH